MVMVSSARNSFRDLRVVADVLVHVARCGDERGKRFCFRDKESEAGFPPGCPPRLLSRGHAFPTHKHSCAEERTGGENRPPQQRQSEQRRERPR